MAGRLLIRITRASGEIKDLRYRHIWSAWLDGELVGKGHCFRPEEAEEHVLDLVTPDQVDHIEIIEPEPRLS